MPHDARPSIEGNLVRLRPLDERDAETVLAIVATPDLDFLTGSHGTVTLEQARQWYGSLATKGDRVDFGIVVRDTGELIGESVLNENEPSRLRN